MSESLDNLRQLLERGAYAEALVAAEALQKTMPDQFEALQLCGVVYALNEQFEKALLLLNRAIEQDDSHTAVFKNRGNVQQALGHYEQALSDYQQAFVLEPSSQELQKNLTGLLRKRFPVDQQISDLLPLCQNYPDQFELQFTLGLAQADAEYFEDARETFSRAISLNPAAASAHNALGNVLKGLEDLDGAIRSYRQALKLSPDFAFARNNLGVVLQLAGRREEAITCFKRAVELNPKLVESLNNLGNLLQEDGKLEEAIAIYRQAVEVNPEYADGYYNLGNALRKRGYTDEAEANFRQSLKLNPDNPSVLNNLAVILKGNGCIDEAITHFGRSLELNPAHCAAHSNYLFAHYYHPKKTAEQIRDQHRHWQQQQTASITPAQLPISGKLERPLRVGILSGQFRRHPVLWLCLPALENLSREGFQLAAYSWSDKQDSLTRRLQQRCDMWREVGELSDEAAAQQIRDDQIDILIDMSGHSEGRLLICAHRAAPVQVQWGGLFGSSGLDEMDWLLADPVQVPEGEEQWYSEQICRLPHGYVNYLPPDFEVEVNPLPALQNGYVTFGCFNNPAKVNATVVARWSRILMALPDSRMLFKGRAYASKTTQRNIRQWFADNGVSATRLIFEGYSPHDQLLARYNAVDIALDTWPYTGGLTTLEALWMGVPTLTVPGPTFAGRHAASHLSNVGLADWVGKDDQDAIEKACGWANNLAQLAQLRTQLREQLLASPLCDRQRFNKHFEAALQGMWNLSAQQQGKPGAVVDAFNSLQHAADGEPDNADLQYKLANALKRQGNLQGAEAAYRKVVELQPDHERAWFNLGNSLGDRGCNSEAMKAYAQALNAKADFSAAYNNLGNLQLKVGQRKEALESYVKAVKYAPDSAQSHNNLAVLLDSQGASAEAWRHYDKAIELKPDFAEAYNNLGTSLSGCGEHERAIQSFRKALSIESGYSSAHSNLLFSLYYHPATTAEQLWQEHQQWQQQQAGHISPAALTPPQSGERPLRIGLASGQFRRHPVMWLTLPALEALDRDKVELFVYSWTGRGDDLSQRLKSLCRSWVDIDLLDDEQAAQRIREDQIDILIDLSGHSEGRPLIYAHRAAPVQVQWGGMYCTSGLKEMDWLLTDSVQVPPGQERWYSERIFRLPHGYVSYLPPTDDVPVGSLPRYRNGYLTFGCFNNPSKVNSEMIAVWAQVLQAVPESRLLLKGKAYTNPDVRKRILDCFAANGIDEARLVLEGFSPNVELLNSYNKIDIALDPWPYTGGLTTLEALWMGVPTITLPGPAYAGRHAASHLTSVGLADWIADDKADYVEKARHWSQHLAQLQALRNGLRPRLLAADICNGDRFARNLERVFDYMWRDCLQRHRANPSAASGITKSEQQEELCEKS